MRCITGARFTMSAELLRTVTQADLDSDSDPTGGNWVQIQDPITGAILNQWVPGADDPETPEYEATPVTVDCVARGIVSGGIRASGTAENFGDTYENIDLVRLWTPARVQITKRDRVTNIREKRGGRVVWLDEESGDSPTVFNVNGVTPLFDAFNRHIENFVLLERAE